MLFFFSGFICSWFTITFIIILYILLGKPGKFLLDINPTNLRLPLPNVNDRIYIRNKKLVDSKKILKDKIINPKSIAFDEKKKHLFTGSSDGNVYRLDLSRNYEIKTIASFPNGGRPLGIRLFRDVLYFIEANSGLYSYDLNSETLKLLLDLKETNFLDGKTSKFFDDLAITEENNDIIIYITDVSRKFSMDMWCYTYLEPDNTGRILKLNLTTGCITVIIENLCFPNGIEITDDNQSLLVCELTKRRILQYQFKGQEIGKTSILMENLPGEPENIRRSAKKDEETYWIGLALTRDYKNYLSFLDDYSTEPNLRKLILRSCYLLGIIMYNTGKIFNNEILKNKGTNLKSGLALILDDFTNNPGMAIEINLHPNVLSSFQIKDDMAVISEIRELPYENDHTRTLYTTSSGGNLNRIILN